MLEVFLVALAADRVVVRPDGGSVLRLHGLDDLEDAVSLMAAQQLQVFDGRLAARDPLEALEGFGAVFDLRAEAYLCVNSAKALMLCSMW